MAFKKSFNEIIGTVLVLSALLSTASAVDCQGKSFHCVNATHFMICVDLGGGVSQTIDNFLIPCPAPTVCLSTNHFECEFRTPTTPVASLNVISETTQPWEDVVVTTNSPQRKTTKEYSEKYLNTESLSLADSFTTDATVDYTTEVLLSSVPFDINSINVTESVSIVPEASVYETTKTVDTITEPVLIYDTTNNLDQVVNAENFTAELITEIPQTIPENIAAGAIEVTTEIPLVDLSAKDPFISNASDIPQIIPENITTGAGEAITEIPLVDITTIEAFISNASDVPQITPENITTGAVEATTEIPFVDITTIEASISNASDVPQIIPENITTGTGEAITEIPLVDTTTIEAFISNASDISQIIPENITTGAGEAITEIPLVDITTIEAFISNASDVPQITPENITTGAGEATTEIPFVDITTIEAFISNASDVLQIIPENITTGTGEALTEIPLVDTTTKEAFISNAFDVPQITPANITTGAGEAITEIPLVDITTIEAFISNASDVPQTPENITTGAGEAITEIPLVDTTTIEAFISNGSDVPQITPENITTGAGEATTEIPFVDITTIEASISNASDVPQIIPENITTGTGEAITEIPLVDTTTIEAFISNASDVPQITPENITTGAGEAITEMPLVDTTTIEAFISNASDVPQITPENITTGAGEATTEIPFVDITTIEASISNASDVPQIIPENITTGAGEATTEIPFVDITTIEASISNASDVPQIIPENITTGTGEAITEIPLVDTTTIEAFISNASDVPQITPENITTDAGEAITEIPLVDITTIEAFISNASDVPQLLPDNITTGAGEAITEIPLVNTTTIEAFISNASDVPQITPENITTGTGEVITEIPLVDVSTVEPFVSNASDVPQIIPENITTGAGEAITEMPLLDVSTVEAFVSNASAVPQIISENITTGAGEAITEIPLVDISTMEAFISNASDIPLIIPENITTAAGEAITEIPIVDISTVNTNNILPETTPSTISANESSSNINVNLKPVPESTPNINITSNATVNEKDYPETTLKTFNTDTIIYTERAVTTKSEESYTTEINSLTNNQLSSTGDLVQNGATLEQTTSDYLSFDIESLHTNQPSTIGPEEILTTDTTVNLITELPALNENNSLNRLPTTIKTVVTQDGITIDSVGTENPTLLINQKDRTQTDDIYTTERPLIVTKNDLVQTISTDDKLRFTTESNLSMNKTDILTGANTNNFAVENIISSLQNKTQTETNETIKSQEETMSTTENGLFKNNTETKETKSTVADLPLGENKIHTNILANTIFDTVISKAELSTEKSTPAISDKNLQKVAMEIITTETSLSTSNDQIQQVTGDVALGTEKTTLITENKVIMDNANLIHKKSTQNITTQFSQDQGASASETTTKDKQISTIHYIKVQENTSALSGTTENINVIVKTSSVDADDVKKIEITIDGTNATGLSSHDTEIDSSVPNIPVTETNITSETNKKSNFSIDQLGTNIRTDALDYTTVAEDNFSSTDNSVKESTNSSVNPDLGRIDNHIIPQLGQTTSESIDKGKLNILETVEGSTNSNQIISDSQANTIINKLNQDSRQTNVAGILVTNDKTMTKNLQANTIIIKNSESDSNLADDVNLSTIATTTKIVNNSIDNYDVSSSRNIETKYTVLENIQNALQGIGNFFNITSKNSTRAISNINNEAQTENNIHVSEVMTETNTATESETVLDSTVLNNFQASKAGAMVPKPDANIKLGSTQSTLVNKNKNVNKPVAYIVPFDEPSGLTNKAQDQVTANVEVSKNRKITSGISPEMVMKPATLDILTTKTNEIGNDGTAYDNEGDLLSTYDSKVYKIEITTEPYKPVISIPATIIPRTTSVPNNLLQNLPLPSVVPEAENIQIVNTKQLGISATTEKTIRNGVKPDIGPVFVNINTNLNEKPIVENEIARENIAQNIRPIATLKPRNSVTEVNNILQPTDSSHSITDSTFHGNTQKDLSPTSIKLEQISGSAQNAKPSTTNSGTRNPAIVVPENIHQIIVPSNQHSDLTGQQKAFVSTVGKEIKPNFITTPAKISTGISAVETTKPQNNTQKITYTGTVFPGNNTSAAPKTTSQTETNNIVSVISRNNTIGGNEQKTINLQQNSSVDTTGQFKRQVTSTTKPVQKPNNSLTSTTQASTKKTASKSVSTVTENSKKQVVNNTLSYSCINGVRGRYSDKHDCRKFYICIGNTQPIIGHCPVNTVFSDIKKLCTKNMSHCIRENEFKCPSAGRFSDVIHDAVYYICVNHNNHLYRFKFQCKKGFTLNKTTVRCVENKEIESNESVSISSDNVSESSDSTSSTSTSSISTSSTSSSSSSKSSSSSSKSSSSSNTSNDSESKSSKSKQKKEKSEDKDDDDDEVFECEKQGKFPVRDDCRRYYLCKKNRKGQYRRKLKKCDSGDVFHKSKKKCVDADDYEC